MRNYIISSKKITSTDEKFAALINEDCSKEKILVKKITIANFSLADQVVYLQKNYQPPVTCEKNKPISNDYCGCKKSDAILKFGALASAPNWCDASCFLLNAEKGNTVIELSEPIELCEGNSLGIICIPTCPTPTCVAVTIEYSVCDHNQGRGREGCCSFWG